MIPTTHGDQARTGCPPRPRTSTTSPSSAGREAGGTRRLEPAAPRTCWAGHRSRRRRSMWVALRARSGGRPAEVGAQGRSPCPRPNLDPASRFVGLVLGELEVDRLGPELQSAILVFDLDDDLANSFDQTSLLSS